MEEELKKQKMAQETKKEEVEEDYEYYSEWDESGSLEKKKGAALMEALSATTSTKQYLAQ